MTNMFDCFFRSFRVYEGLIELMAGRRGWGQEIFLIKV